MDSTDAAWCRHDWQIYFDDPDTESCIWCGTERMNPLAAGSAGFSHSADWWTASTA